jgi:hypothetical protein
MTGLEMIATVTVTACSSIITGVVIWGARKVSGAVEQSNKTAQDLAHHDQICGERWANIQRQMAVRNQLDDTRHEESKVSIKELNDNVNLLIRRY